VTALRPHPGAGPSGPRDDGLAERLHDLLEGAGAATATLVAATIEVPAADPVAVFAAAVEADLEAALWLRPSDGAAYVGIGRAWALEPEGPGRFRAAEDAWRALVARARIDGPPARHGGGPVVMGGLGFTGRRPDPADPWGPFGAASLVLPDLLLAVTPDGSRLTGSLLAGDGGPSAARGLERRWDRIAERARSITPNPAGMVARPVVAALLGGSPFFLRLARGQSIGQMALNMSLNAKTVSTYRSRVMEKMKLGSNSALNEVNTPTNCL